MHESFTAGDRGKRVVTTDGDPLGWVERVEEGTAYVRPNPGLLVGCGSWVAPSWKERDRFRLDEGSVVGITDATVVLDVGERPTGDDDSEHRKYGRKKPGSPR